LTFRQCEQFGADLSNRRGQCTVDILRAHSFRVTFEFREIALVIRVITRIGMLLDLSSSFRVPASLALSRYASAALVAGRARRATRRVTREGCDSHRRWTRFAPADSEIRVISRNPRWRSNRPALRRSPCPESRSPRPRLYGDPSTCVSRGGTRPQVRKRKRQERLALSRAGSTPRASSLVRLVHTRQHALSVLAYPCPPVREFPLDRGTRNGGLHLSKRLKAHAHPPRVEYSTVVSPTPGFRGGVSMRRFA
jgi:hypothetical protein